MQYDSFHDRLLLMLDDPDVQLKILSIIEEAAREKNPAILTLLKRPIDTTGR